MVDKRLVDFPAYTGLEKRKVYIYTPTTYNKCKDSYPVLYMFDGQNVFYDDEATYGRGWRMHEFLDYNDIPLIVVSVECHRGINEERMQEYSPYKCSFEGEKYFPHADETMKWFIKALKPQVDANYRTKPDRKHTFIGGSSMGGILSTYCLLRFNKVFSRAISMSPAYYMFYKPTLAAIKEAKVTKDTTIYTDYGTRDLEGKPAIEIFNKVNTKLIEKGINVTSRIIYEGVHNEENWDKQLMFAISTLMYELER